MAHTPGPWEAKPTVGRIVLNGSSIYGVADITGEFARWNPDDLALMAAAPDLLEACRHAVHALNTAPRFRCGTFNSYDIASMCDHAIAKAEGRSDEE